MFIFFLRKSTSNILIKNYFIETNKHIYYFHHSTLFDVIVVVLGVDGSGGDDDNKRFFWEIFNVSFSLYLGVIGRWLSELRDFDWYLYRNVDSVDTNDDDDHFLVCHVDMNADLRYHHLFLYHSVHFYDL